MAAERPSVRPVPTHRPGSRGAMDGPLRGTRTLPVRCSSRSLIVGRVISMRLYSARIDGVEIALASAVAVSFITLLASIAWLLIG